MVKSFKNQWGETNAGGGSTKYVVFFILFIIFVLGFIIYAYLNHPITNFEAGPVNRDGSDVVVITAVNDGTLKEEYIELTLSTEPVECNLISGGEGCHYLLSNRLLCDYLGPGEDISIECPLPQNGTVYGLYMKSKYQTSKLEYACSSQKCHETADYLHGSFPVAWNYLLAYPADRLIDIYGYFSPQAEE